MAITPKFGTNESRKNAILRVELSQTVVFGGSIMLSRTCFIYEWVQYTHSINPFDLVPQTSK
jgi:hypothetical protein